MFGHRSPVPPDPTLLARVGNDEVEVDLGTYPEAALATLGIDPHHGSSDKWPPDYSSPFGRLTGPARDAAMQAALDQLIAEGTVQLPADARLHQVVEDGQRGRLKLSEPLATLHELAYWCHRHRERIKIAVRFEASDGLANVPMPGGLHLPVAEICYGLPGHKSYFLAARADHHTGTITYTLCTALQVFRRVEEFLFADITTSGESLVATVEMAFTHTVYGLSAGMVAVSLGFRRDHGEQTVVSEFNGLSASMAGLQPTESRSKTFPRRGVSLVLVKCFTACAQKI
jgi:hypothetical protein